jgi:uncharacterized membrane protein
MEQNKKSGPLLAGAIAGFAYWIALTVLMVIGVIKSQTGFFEGMSNLVKSITQGFEGAGWVVYIILAFFALLAASGLNLFAYLKGGAIPAYIAAVLYLPSLNFVSPALCVIGAKPRFLEGRKTMLFVAGYIGAVVTLLWAAMSFLPGMDGARTAFTVFALITLAALALNFFGWRKNNALITLIAGIVYVLSVLGVPSAILCFIVYAKLEKPFLRGKRTMLFSAFCIGAAAFLFLAALCFMPELDAGSRTMFIVFVLITLVAVILNFFGWRTNNAKMTLIAAIVYIISIFGIPSAVLCFIGRAKLKTQQA